MTLCDTAQYVHYLSPTEGGRQHDKRLADDYALHLPAGCVLCQDLGLLGHAPAGVIVEMPHKKPPKRELTFSQQLYNQLLSPLRVVIEHAHSGIKRLRMVADTVRLRGNGDATWSWWWPAGCTTCACAVRSGRIPRPYPRNSPCLPNKVY